MPRKVSFNLDMETKTALQRLKKFEKQIEKVVGKAEDIEVKLESKKFKKNVGDFSKDVSQKFRKLNKETKVYPKLEKGYIDKSIKDLGVEFQRFARDTGKEINKLDFDNLQKEIVDTKVNLEKLKDVQRKVLKSEGRSDSYRSLQREIDNVSDSLTEARRKMKNLRNTGDITTSRLQRKFDGLRKSASSSFNGIRSAAASAFAFIGGFNIVKSIFGSSAEVEQTRTAFNLLLGDTQKAGILLDDLAKFSANTPFEFPELADGARKLKSVAGVAEKDLIPTLEALGDITASQGKGIEQIVEAYNDAITGEFERLKEFGIRASSQGDKVTFTFKGQKKTVEKTSESIGNYLKELSKAEGVTGAMEKQSKTLNGRISTLKDNFGFLAKSIVGVSASGEILEGGIMYYVSEFIGQIGTLVKQYKEWAAQNPKLSNTIGILVAGAGILLAILIPLGLALGSIGIAIGVLISPITLVAGAVYALGLAFSTNFLGIRDKVQELYEFLNAKFGDEIRQLFDGFKEYFTGLFELLKTVIQGFMYFFTTEKSNLDKNLQGLRTAFEILGSVIQAVFANILSVIEFALSVVGNTFKAFGKAMKGDFQGAFDSVLSIVSSFGDLLKDLLGNTMEASLNILGSFSQDARKWGENLIQAIVDGIYSKVDEVKKSVTEVGEQIKGFLGVASPTKYGPLALDQSIWGKNLIDAIVSGIKSKSKLVRETVNGIAQQLLGLQVLQKKYKTQDSVSNRISVLSTKLGKTDFGTTNFDKISNEIEQLQELQKKYNGEQTKYEKEIFNVKEKAFKKELKNISELDKEQSRNEKDSIKKLGIKHSSLKKILQLQDELNLSSEQESVLLDKALDYKKEISSIASEILKKQEEEAQSVEKTIQKINTEIDAIQGRISSLENGRNKSIAKRRIQIEEERTEVLNKVSKDDSFRASRKIQKIDEKLYGSISEEKRLNLLDQRKEYIKQLNAELKNENSLTKEQYELKQQLLSLEKELITSKQNTDGKTLINERRRADRNQTENILFDFELEKKQLDKQLEEKLKSIQTEKNKLEELNGFRISSEVQLTGTIKQETSKRITEFNRMLENGRRVARELAKIGFNGQGFKAVFTKVGEDGKRQTVTRTINNTFNNTITHPVNEKKLSRSIAKQVARAESTGNKF